jgi:hypothetical protein
VRLSPARVPLSRLVLRTFFVTVWAAPVLAAASLLRPIAELLRESTFALLGRDQGIFQAIVWQMQTHNARLYVDLRDINGPTVYLVHHFFSFLGGFDERRFRLLDVLVTCLVYLVTGALGGAALSRARVVSEPVATAYGRTFRKPALRALLVPRWSESALGAVIALALLSLQYLRYLAWDQAQRESMANWFLLPALMLSAWPDAEASDKARARASLAQPSARFGWLSPFGVGALLCVAAFAKPTYGIFLLAYWATLLVMGIGRRSMLRGYVFSCVGALLATASVLGFVELHGSASACVRLYLFESRALYGFLWWRDLASLFSLDWVSGPALVAVATVLVSLALHAINIFPRQLILVTCSPLLGLVCVWLQRKGFPYHLHPVTACSVLLWTLTLMALRQEALRARVSAPAARVTLGLLALVASAAWVAFGLRALPRTPAAQNAWMLTRAQDRIGFDGFRAPDFFPADLREAAAFLRAQTEQGSLQVYGMDPYILFLAQRRSATPYLYSYDLNVEAARDGAVELADMDVTAPAPMRVVAMGTRHGTDLLARLKAAPPAAWTLIDRPPWSSRDDAREDLAHAQPEVFEFLEQNYEEVRAFGSVHVWLQKRDLQ